MRIQAAGRCGVLQNTAGFDAQRQSCHWQYSGALAAAFTFAHFSTETYRPLPISCTHRWLKQFVRWPMSSACSAFAEQISCTRIFYRCCFALRAANYSPEDCDSIVTTHEEDAQFVFWNCSGSCHAHFLSYIFQQVDGLEARKNEVATAHALCHRDLYSFTNEWILALYAPKPCMLWVRARSTSMSSQPQQQWCYNSYTSACDSCDSLRSPAVYDQWHLTLSQL